MQEISGSKFVQTLVEKKKTILQVVVGVIVVLSIIGNAWAFWKHYTNKIKEVSRNDGWALFGAQLIGQSEGCRAVDVTSGDRTERFIRTACLTAPATAAPAPAAPATRTPAAPAPAAPATRTPAAPAPAR